MNLTPTARNEVMRLLAIQDPIFAHMARNRQFGWACTYPDHPISLPQRRSPEHYVNYARTLTAVTSLSGCGSATRCVLRAIATDFDRLRSTSQTDAVRLRALIYLGHWVGDIHQPLHSSYSDDVGGNELRSRGDCTGKFHNTWDTCIIQRQVFAGVASPDVDTLQTLAANWNASISAAQRAAWRGSEPWQWSAESYAFSINPNLQYCVMVGPACQYESTRLTYTGTPRRFIQIDTPYMTMAMGIIPERIQRGGVRLALLINRALDPSFTG